MPNKIDIFIQKIKSDLNIDFDLKNDEDFLKNIKWDSLLNMGLLAHLDREYNLVIDFDDLQKYNSLIKLFELVEEKIIDKPAITKIEYFIPSEDFSTSNVLSKNYKDASAIEKIINKTGIDQKYKSEKINMHRT